ncbi:MAG: sigma-70 family RNA polymerase sigma factor [Clostridiaceae bacterium]|jgi:RNA polymerase sigma-70 factor (ECF subfamily)|nr:sigma-70 family RNA polymerase sigma factor [Clostridiaceae bacterium]
MDDLVRIRRCLAGEKEAFEPLVSKYKNLVYGIALNILHNRDEAADATQEVFLKAWANLGRYNPEYSFKAWIARIAVNHSINVSQKNRRSAAAWDEDAVFRIPANSGLPEEELLYREEQDRVKQAVESLPEMYRLMVILFHQQSLSYDEICQVTDYPLSIVKNRLYRARKMLCERLRGYYEGAGEEETSWAVKKHGS